MNNFMEFMDQIREDLQLIKKEYGYIDSRLQRDEFAFNYWVLSRLYSLDEEVIPSNITDINDKGIDCFAHYEDTKELYIIQNKFYGVNTSVSRPEATDFLTTPLNVLLNGGYSRCEELQQIFNRAKDDSDYKIWLHFYVTNDNRNMDVENTFAQFNFHDPRVSAFVGAKFNKLEDIRLIYYGERFTKKGTFTTKLTTRVAGTSLDVRPKDYGLDWMIDLRFMMVNVVELYEMYKQAIHRNYMLFEENVREYLGTRGINNGIIKTLQSSTDRENFFYYNNGITLICEELKTLRPSAGMSSGQQNQYGFELKNPQIVNGCQTINSIAEVLSRCSESKLASEFGRTFVLVKMYVFDKHTREEKSGLDQSIVMYTNSQNGISEKAFASKAKYFANIQSEFKKRGFLLLVKPSDKNKFSIEYKSQKSQIAFAKLREKGRDLLEMFGMDASNFKNYMIPLEKLLKVLLAFERNGFYAFTKGSSVLKPGSPYYKDFSLCIDQMFTIDNMINLYLLFARADLDQKASENKNMPIPYYVLGFLGNVFSGMEFHPKNEKLKNLFASKESFLPIYDFYSKLTASYFDSYSREHREEYNKMIKQAIDNKILEVVTKEALRWQANGTIKDFLGQ